MNKLTRRTSLATCVGLTAALLSGCVLFDNYRYLTLADFVENEVTPEVTTNPRDITADECGTQIDCVEAFDTEEARYYRFDSRESAAQFSESLNDSFAVHYVVMDFAGKDDAEKSAQNSAMEQLANTWQDYEGEIPAR